MSSTGTMDGATTSSTFPMLSTSTPRPLPTTANPFTNCPNPDYEDCQDPGIANDEYEQFIFVLAPTILAIAIVMCCARLLFVYCSYRRDHLRARQRRTTTAAGAERGRTVTADPLNDFMAAARNQGLVLVPPPPSYDTIFKRDMAAPPVYSATAPMDNRPRANSDPTSSRYIDLPVVAPQRIAPRRPVTVDVPEEIIASCHSPVNNNPSAPVMETRILSSRSPSVSTQSTVAPLELRPESFV